MTITLSVTRGTTGIDSRRRRTVVRPCRCRRRRVGAERSLSFSVVFGSTLAFFGWSDFLRVVVFAAEPLVEGLGGRSSPSASAASAISPAGLALLRPRPPRERRRRVPVVVPVDPSVRPSTGSVPGSVSGSVSVSVAEGASAVVVPLAAAPELLPLRPRPRPPRDRRRVPTGRAPVDARSTSPGWASRSTSGCSSVVGRSARREPPRPRAGAAWTSLEAGAAVFAPPSSAVAPVPAPDPERPRPPRPRPPRRRLRAPEPGVGEPPWPVPVAVDPPSVEPGASLGSAISVLETAEPRSSFIVAPFVWGGPRAVLAERTGSVAPERPLGRRFGTRGPGGLASSVGRTAVGTSSPRPCGASLRTRKAPFSAGSSGRGLPGSVPGPAWPAPRLSLPRRLLAAPWPRPGGQTWYQGYRTPRLPDDIRGGKPRAYPDRQAPRTR